MMQYDCNAIALVKKGPGSLKDSFFFVTDLFGTQLRSECPMVSCVVFQEWR